MKFLQAGIEAYRSYAQQLIQKLVTPVECQTPKSRTLEELLAIKPLEEWLNPPSPGFTEAEHQLALSRLAFDDNIFGWLYYMKQYIVVSNDLAASPDELEKAKRYAIQSIEEFDNWGAQRGDGEWWDGLFYGNTARFLREALTSPHSGDCTAAPCTCQRCLAEEYYRISYTVYRDLHKARRLLAMASLCKIFSKRAIIRSQNELS